MSDTEREAWLAERRSGIGSSDIAAVCGVHPYRTALEVAMDKLGLVEDHDSLRLRLGRKIEPVVASEYTEATGVELEGPMALMRHPEHAFLLATLDRVTKPLENRRVVELKTAGWHMKGNYGEEGTDQVPDEYVMQCQHQMLVSGLPLADLAVLIDNRQFKIYTIEANVRLHALIIEKGSEFWDLVSHGRLPEPDFQHKATLDAVRNLYPAKPGTVTPLTDEALATYLEYQEVGARIRELEKLKKSLQARVLWSLGEAQVGTLADGRELRRSIVNVTEKTVAAYSYERLSMTKPKRQRELTGDQPCQTSPPTPLPTSN